MLNFEFCSPTHFVFGKDTEQQTGDLALRYGAKKVLIVYGQGSVVRSGLLARVEKSLTEAGLCFGELGGVKPNPEDGLVREGIAMVRREKYDFLLAVGGGSAIDTAKAIALGVPYDGDFWDFYAGKAEAKEAMPVGVVLTIPAAGSEASGNTVITNVATGQKISLRCPLLLRPRFSVLNPELTFTLPHFQTACGICDMMVHIFERYFSNTPSTEVTDRISEGLLQSIITEGRRLMECPDDYEARANIMWAGTLAHNGVCGTGREEDWSSHAIEHELSALYGVTHGAGLAVVFPAWLKVVSKVNDFRTLQLAERLFGIEADGRPKAEVINECISHLQDFWSGTLGLPRNLSELGIDNADIDQLVNNLHHTKGEVFGGYWWLPLPILQNMTLIAVNQPLAISYLVTQNQRGTKTGQNHGKIKSRTLRSKYPLWNTSVSFAKLQICPLKNEGKSLFLSFTTHFPTIVPQMWLLQTVWFAKIGC